MGKPPARVKIQPSEITQEKGEEKCGGGDLGDEHFGGGFTVGWLREVSRDRDLPRRQGQALGS